MGLLELKSCYNVLHHKGRLYHVIQNQRPIPHVRCSMLNVQRKHLQPAWSYDPADGRRRQ